MEVHFYLPEKYSPDSARQEAWKQGKMTVLEQGGKIASAQAWIFQTWLALTQSGFPAKLTHEVPESGLLVSLTGFFGDEQKFSPDVFFAGIVADFVPHPGAQAHIVQNSAHARRLGNALFMPHWPHPNLIARDPARGEVFEKVRFYGDASNLAPELRDPGWARRCREELGVDFTVCAADQWHDYREADCAVAVRDFSSAAHLHKPATKLYNAWLAEVPFVGGVESSYASDGTSGENFLRAGTAEELFRQIARLKQDGELRRQIIQAGREAGRAFSAAATTERWRELLGTTLRKQAEEYLLTNNGKRRVRSLINRSRVWLDRRFRS